MASKEDSTTGDTLTLLDQYFIAAVTHPTATDWIKNATKDFEFQEGKQWTDTEKKELSSRGQPDTVENLIAAKVNRLKGQYKNQKTRIIYRGRNVQTDEPAAQVLTDLALHIQQQSQYEFEESDCFDDGIISGVGWLEPYVEFDDMFEPSIRIRHEDCLNVFPDPYSRKYDLSDAKYICIAKWVHLNEAIALYPDKKLQLNGLYTSASESGSLSGVDKLRNENYVDSKNQRVRLVEIRWKEQTKKSIGIYSDPQTGNQTVDFSKITKKQQKEFQSLPGARVLNKLIDRIKIAVFCGGVVLDDIKDLPHSYKSLFMIPYYVYRKKNGEPYGVVRALIDPQTERNKRRSKALHLLLTNKVILSEGAVRDKDEFRAENARPDGLPEVRGIEKIKVVDNIELAQGQMQLLSESEATMDKIIGMPMEPGATGQLRSGIAVARKQATVDLNITAIFENMRRTRLLVGRHILELIKQYYTEEKAFYVLDDMKKAKQVNLTGDHIQSIKSSIYDTIVDEMPDTVNLQDEQFQAIGQFLQSANLPPQLAMAMFPIWIGLSTIRDKDQVIQKFEQMMQPSPILPKMSLNINWDALYPEEKAVFADMFGRKDLSQQEMQLNRDPSQIVKSKEGLQKTQMKTQVDMQKNQPDPQAQQQELQQKQAEAAMKMQQSQQQHQQKIGQSAQQHGQKMQQQSEQGQMKMIQAAMNAAATKGKGNGEQGTDNRPRGNQ